MLRPLLLPIFNGPNYTKSRNTYYEVHSVIHNIVFPTYKYSHWQHVLLTHSGLGVERRPPFRRIQNQEAGTDKVSQISVTDDVTWQSGEWYTEMSTLEGG
jgi:hypothetical protein